MLESDLFENEKMTRRLSLACLFALLLMSVPLIVANAADHDVRGADIIFEQLGQEVPEDWSSWTRAERHAHWRTMGVYPADGSAKYAGKTDELGSYFEWLGIPEPSDWNRLSFEERKSIVDDALADRNTDAATDEVPEADIPEIIAEENDRVDPVTPAVFSLKLILLVIGIIAGVIMMIASYTVDGFRARRKVS